MASATLQNQSDEIKQLKQGIMAELGKMPIEKLRMMLKRQRLLSRAYEEEEQRIQYFLKNGAKDRHEAEQLLDAEVREMRHKCYPNK